MLIIKHDGWYAYSLTDVALTVAEQERQTKCGILQCTQLHTSATMKLKTSVWEYCNCTQNRRHDCSLHFSSATYISHI